MIVPCDATQAVQATGGEVVKKTVIHRKTHQNSGFFAQKLCLFT